MRYLLPALALASLCAGCVQPPPPPPPPQMVSELAASVPGANPNCREYTATGTLNGQPQAVVGRACRQPDGTWRLATEEDEEETLPQLTDFKSSPAVDTPACVDYSATALYGAERQPLVGRACTQPDGFIRITQGTPEQPALISVVYPGLTPDYPYYADYYYDPWFWGPPFIGVGGTFIFVGHRHFGHGFGGHGWAHGGWGGRGGGHGGGGGHH
jgi:hypothetical protein